MLKLVTFPVTVVLNRNSFFRRIPYIRLPKGEIHFECEGKKVEFFLILVYIQIGIQARVEPTTNPSFSG
jgi:hypothetical protein